MLVERHHFNKQSLDAILELYSRERSGPLQDFAEMLCHCVKEYQDEFPVAFREHYAYTIVAESGQERMERADFRVLSEELRNLLNE